MRDFSSRRRPRPPGRLELVLLGAGGLALAVALYGAFEAWREQTRVRRRVEQARGEAESARSRSRLFESRQDAGQLLAMQALLTAEAPPSRIVSELALILPGDVRLEGLQLVYGSRLNLEMRVAARAPASYDLFLDRLEQSPSFTEILPGDENREGELRALVRAVWKGPGV